MAASAQQGIATRVRSAVGWRVRRLDERTRRATASLRMRPSFLVIGAQKAGTTSLYAYLTAHPAVLGASIKEVQYFSKFYDRGDDWYLAYFPLELRGGAARLRAGTRPAVGEASATYLFHPRAPERVHRFDPGMRLIAVLRDPVDRAYSHYQMEHRWGREQLSFEDALDREAALAPELERMIAEPGYESQEAIDCSYVARGRYAEQLERWLERFPREHLLILTSDELLADPGGSMETVARFLGVPARRATSYPLRGVREYGTMAPETREHLIRTFAPETERLERLVGHALPWTPPRD